MTLSSIGKISNTCDIINGMITIPEIITRTSQLPMTEVTGILAQEILSASCIYTGNATIGGTTNNGNIKDLMLFKKALTVDQIGAIMDEIYIF